MKRGIRWVCPQSGQLYSLVIESLLCRLRLELQGLSVRGLQENLVSSAYADDLTYYQKPRGHSSSDLQPIYSGPSWEHVNWDKCESFLVGEWQRQGLSILPGSLQWGKAGLKYLGVFIGTADLQNNNWEGAVEKVCQVVSVDLGPAPAVLSGESTGHQQPDHLHSVALNLQKHWLGKSRRGL